MRIIAGTKKGRKLLSPVNEGRITRKGDVHATRPTLDRVKEAMFSIIQTKIPGAVVLDLFAGTGSLGLEAASRGAGEVILVDYFKETYDLLVENIDNLEFNEKCKALYADYRDALKRLQAENLVFDIIFIDPPYLNQMIPGAIEFIEKNAMLSRSGVIITKTDTSEEVTEGYGRIAKLFDRKYGNTTLGFYQYED